MLVSLAPEMIPAETVTQPWWELALVMMGAVSVGCAFLVIVWKIARPHIKGYIESVVKPLQTTANATHHQLTKNGHTSATPTVLDRVDGLSSKVDELHRLSHRNVTKIDMLGASLDAHKQDGRAMIAEAVRQFSAQGITLHVEDHGYGDD